jgi:hypothetical protein
VHIGRLEPLLSLRAGLPSYAALAAYGAAQVAPVLSPGDPAVTGEGRIFAINMMDAKVECDHFEFARDGAVIHETSELYPNVGVRIRCDPIRFWNKARNVCRAGEELGGSPRVESYLLAKRTTDPTYQHVYAVDDFCGDKPRMDVFSHNAWIGR